MNPDADSARQHAIREFKAWLKDKQFEGVSGSGEDGVGVRVYVNSKKIKVETQDTIKARADGIRLTFVEHDGPIKQY